MTIASDSTKPIVGARLLGAVGLSLFLIGCGGDPQPIAEPAPTAAVETPVAPSADPAVTPELPKTEPVSTQTSGWPDDVFFEDPLAIAANDTPVPGAENAVASTGMTGQPKAESPVETPASETASKTDWSTLLPAELLVEEVNRARQRLEPKVDSVANFNTSFLEFPPYVATIAALANIAPQYSAPIPWKENAKYIRELAAEMNSQKLVRGEKSFKQVSEPFAKITQLLDGKKPAELPEADETGDFALSADFGHLMKRLEIGQNALKNDGAGEALFSKNKADLEREAALMAALAQVIASADYGYGDDPEFRQYAEQMRKSSVDTAAAVKAGDYAKFDLAQSGIMQACTQCHSAYRN